MVGVGVGIENSFQIPAVFIKYLAYLASGVLVASAVNEVCVHAVKVYSYFCGTVYIVSICANLFKLVHRHSLRYQPISIEYAKTYSFSGESLIACGIFVMLSSLSQYTGTLLQGSRQTNFACSVIALSSK